MSRIVTALAALMLASQAQAIPNAKSSGLHQIRNHGASPCLSEPPPDELEANDWWPARGP